MDFLNVVICLIAICTPRTQGYKVLSDETLHRLPDGGKDFDIKNGALLAPILQPRVPGSPGQEAVLQHFVNFFNTSLPKWKIDFQNSTSITPTSAGKEIPFKNLILTRDPPHSQPGDVGRLALVAHFDSLSTLEGFIGAIDSAAPCAMIMHVARSIDAALTRKWAKMKASGNFMELESAKGIQLIFTDGEEAFEHWSETDSTYGARALAEEWETTRNPAMSHYHNLLRSIDLFVLLDLLGAEPEYSAIPSYFLPTHWAYQAMAKIENRLRNLKLFKSSPNHPSKRSPGGQTEPIFLPDSEKDPMKFGPSHMGDDHVPFQDRGVEILHLIPSDFPPVWHQMTDDGEHLDQAVVEDWTKIVTAFAAEYMELESFLHDSKTLAKNHHSSDSHKGDSGVKKVEL
ncbi:MAG: hypothetical protein M1831_002704 [Alyxoria varia]|nr:MAG: hypothetical protein M1831_002704 [Alyxoria varia]